MTFNGDELQALILAYGWPFLRIGAALAVAPVFSAAVVPMRVRLVLALALTVLAVPLLPDAEPVDPFSATGLVVACNQVLLGMAMGFAVQLAFDAIVIAGQTIAMSMGLGFAMLLDPQRGVSVPVLSQFFLIVAILIFLALGGHLAIVELVVTSFRWMPVTGASLDPNGWLALAGWGTQMFAGAVQVALPAVLALMLVNLGFGVMSRAAPTLNLFAVGFPVNLLTGFFIVMLGLANLEGGFSAVLDEAFALARRIAGG